MLLNLKEMREKKEMTQLQLAEAVGVVRQTICEIERGTNRPSVNTAKAIAKVLDFEWTEFFPDEKVILNDEGGEK